MKNISLTLYIMVAMKDFSRKWLVVKICSFTGHFILKGHIECYKLLYTYFFRYTFMYLPNILFINTLKH